jgi:PAS domain S-box-containing protein
MFSRLWESVKPRKVASRKMRSAERAPFGLEPVQPAFDRATRLAKLLFDALESNIILIDGDLAWRSRGGETYVPSPTSIPRRAMDSGDTVWIEDGTLDPKYANDHAVTKLGVRFYAAAPVTLNDGTTPGVIAVMDRRPRAYDANLAKGLELLAAGVAEECNRARAAVVAARNAEELDKTRATLAAFVDSVPVMLVMLDRESRVLKASPRWLKVRGLTEADALGRSIFDLTPPGFARFKPHVERCQAGESIHEPRIESVNGTGRVWHQMDFTPWRDSAGEIGGVMLAAHAVTEIVEAMEQTRRSEERLRIAVELTNIQIYDFDHTRREVASDGVSFTKDRQQDFESASEGIWDAVHPHDRPAAQALWAKHIADGTPYKTQYRIMRPDRPHRWVEGVSEAIRGPDGRIDRIIGAMRDIDREKRNEIDLVNARDAAEAANRAKSAFLATMSHEIRTPLNGVLGMAQAMAADELSAVQRERLDVVRQSGEGLLTILNDVLDLSKIEAGKLELEEAEFSIREVATSAHAAFTALANAKGLRFDLKIDEAAQGIYLGDATRVRQILYNLISNGLKFTQEGEVRVLVEADTPGLRLAISDTGMGIPADRLKDLFQMFEQADTSTTRKFGGTGLGLAICRELAELMGGAITAQSAEGQGSCFIVELPLARVGDEVAGKVAEAELKPASVAPALRVLAAEDNAVNQLVIRTLLEQAGVEPFVVADGVQALEAWERETWDLILMDVQMPAMDGPTATREIRAREAASGRRRTPLIALTANAMAHQVAEYRAAGMDAIVAKPIDVEQLLSAMRDLLEQSPPAEEAAA